MELLPENFSSLRSLEFLALDDNPLNVEQTAAVLSTMKQDLLLTSPDREVPAQNDENQLIVILEEQMMKELSDSGMLPKVRPRDPW